VEPCHILTAPANSNASTEPWPSAAEKTCERNTTELKRRTPSATRTTDVQLASAATTSWKPEQLEACKAYKRLGKVVGLAGLDKLIEMQTPYEPKEQELPTEEQLAEPLLEVMDHHRCGQYQET